MLEKEDLRWRQRAKTNLYKLGDRNTMYFHAYANQRKRRNQIKEVKNESNKRVSMHKEIEETFRRYFEKLFQSTKPSRKDILECVMALKQGSQQRLMKESQ